MANYILKDCLAYVASASSLQAKIDAIETIILNNIALIGANTVGQAGGTNMYELDDGQIRIKVIYRSNKELLETNTALEAMQQMYIQRLDGRVTILRDKSTYRRGFGWGGCS